MILQAQGSKSDIAWCEEVAVTNQLTPVRGGELSWRRFDIRTLFIAQSSALLLLEGMPLQRLFPVSAAFKRPGEIVEGPFVFLRGKLSEFYSAPLLLEGVVLGSIKSLPPGLTQQEVLSALVMSALAS